MSLQLLQQRRVLVQAHEGLAEASCQHQDPRTAGTFRFHELTQVLAEQQGQGGREKRLQLATRARALCQS